MASVQTGQKQKVLKVKAVYQKRKLFRANEPLLSVFMWGINHSICDSGHIIHTWCSQPLLNRRVHSGDFLTSVAVLTSGNNFGKLALWAQHLNLKFPSPTTFHKIQRHYIIPTIDTYWEEKQDELISSFQDQDLIVLESAYPDVKHSHDIWHAAKNLGKKIMKLAQKKENQVLLHWQRDILNHFWFSCSRATTYLEFLVSELNHVNIPVMLMPDDFKAYTKVRVDNHLYNKENMPSHFKVKEYCPIVFRNLRERFGIDDQDYMNSLTKQPSGTDSPGRSGARMLMSHDKRYFIKTLVQEEVEQMHHLLKQYHQHIVECHAQTLLPHYLGMYRITVNDVETYLVVMRNVFSPRLPLHRKYDLKGSTVDRCASEKEKAKVLPTLKDNDFVEDGVKLCIGPEAKETLIGRLTKDVEFLTGLHLMDYSLIVGIHDCERGDVQDGMDMNPLATDSDEPVSGEEENGVDYEVDVPDIGGFAPTPPDSPQPNNPVPAFNGDIDPTLERFGIKSVEGGPKKEVYFLALIDILTRYGMKKRTAQAAKTMKHGAGAEISTVHPEQYAKRFLEFIDKCIE